MTTRRDITAELATELDYAHRIISVLLNTIPTGLKPEMAARLSVIHPGEGAVRANERAAVLASFRSQDLACQDAVQGGQLR